MAKRKHIWVESSNKKHRWCEACGTDRTPAAEKEACRPTRLGF